MLLVGSSVARDMYHRLGLWVPDMSFGATVVVPDLLEFAGRRKGWLG